MSGYVKFVHNVASGPNVDILLDGQVVIQNVVYKAISMYISVPAGKHVVSINAGEDTILQKNVNIDEDQHYTAIVHGLITKPSSLNVLVVMDDLACPDDGVSHVRFIHAAAGNPAVDVYFSEQDVYENRHLVLDMDRDLVFGNIKYGELTDFYPVESQNVHIDVTPANSSDIVLEKNATLESMKIYTLIATGIAGNKDTPLDALVTVDSDCMKMVAW